MKNEKTLDEIGLEKFFDNFSAKQSKQKKAKVRSGPVTEIFTGELLEETPLEKVCKFLEEKEFYEVELIREKIMDHGNRIFFFLQSENDFALQVGYNSRTGITFLREATPGFVSDKTEYFNR